MRICGGDGVSGGSSGEQGVNDGWGVGRGTCKIEVVEDLLVS